MVVADDDTMVFVERLAVLLRSYDSSLPLYLGHWAWGECHPRKRRRMPETPLHFFSCCDDEFQRPCRVGWVPPSGCNQRGLALHARSHEWCPPDYVRRGDGLVDIRCRECFCPVSSAGEGRYRLDLENGSATLLPAVAFPYGGSGVLLSAGLLDSIPSSDWADCAARLRCGPSDFRVATCVQNLGGVSFGDWNAPVVRMDIYRHLDWWQDEPDGLSLETWPWSIHRADERIGGLLWRLFRHKMGQPAAEGRAQAAGEPGRRGQRERRWRSETLGKARRQGLGGYSAFD
mmetsp:Transcript_36947/g.119262  ORF Transcript_36947/g.119262 Transcript_36947/m.119262 type:complete len:288 (-) Transcript_36947:151-1014(-)